MKSFQIYLPADPRIIEMVAKRRGWDWNTKRDYKNFKEDYSLKSHKFPIFSVADGITLSVNPGQKYPSPSGAGEAAKIFCQEIIKKAEKLYNSFGEKEIISAFEKANESVAEYNGKQGKIEEKINYWDTDYYSCTGTFALLKDNKLFWGSVSDSRIACYDKKGSLKYLSDDGWSYFEKNKPKNWDQLPVREKSTTRQKLFRNRISPKGEKIGYGAITGEKNTLRYLDHGCLDINKGDFFIILTDGFSPYLKEKFFVDLFKEWPSDLGKILPMKVNSFIKNKEPRDKEELYKFLYDYASERTSIAVSNT